MWYSYASNFDFIFPVSVEKVKEVIELKKKNILPEQLEPIKAKEDKKVDYENVVGQDDITRFDDKKEMISIKILVFPVISFC